jgi:hemerythrin-like domain-containing protein
MLRDKNLIPLSHQHQRALALCVRIDRAQPISVSDLEAWRVEVVQHFEKEIRIHFAAEELVVFPAAREFQELTELIDQLQNDHAWLRDRFAAAEARPVSAEDLLTLAQRLSTHIRTEERQLFQRLQELMSSEELAILGRKLQEALEGAGQACILPTAATRLRPAN